VLTATIHQKAYTKGGVIENMKAVKRKLSYSRRPSATNVTISPSAAAHPWEEDREKVLSVGASFSVKVSMPYFYNDVFVLHSKL